MPRARLAAMRYLAATALILCALATQALPQAPGRSGGVALAGEDRNARSSTTPAPEGRKVPCKTPQNASLCYWTHGRLAVYNGNPTWRIWKIGTHRVFGVYSGPSRYPPRADTDSENPEFPASLNAAYDADYNRRVAAKDPDTAFPDQVFGDFEICPLEPERKGEMQPVCIESAGHFVFQAYFPLY